MTDLAVLRARLALLTAAPAPLTAQGRALPRADMAAVLAEISETILPRRLTFTSDTGAQLVLTASAGRILSLAEGPPLGPADRDQVARALADFAAGAGQIRVRSALLADPPDGAEPGLPPQIFQATAPGLADQLAALCQAYLCLDGDMVTCETGPPDLVEALVALAEAELNAAEAQAPGDSCVLFGGAGRGLLCAARDGQMHFALFDPLQMPQVLALWQAHRG